MAKIMYNQKWYSINQYPLDYFELLYQYYSSVGISTPVTYYNLDLSNSVYDGELLDNGPYELMGNLSGLLWKKILLLPMYQIEQVNFTLNASEEGAFFQNRRTSMFLPTSYEFRPYVHDFICYDQITWRNDPFKAETPLYEVANVEKASSAEITFWRIQLQETPRQKHVIENQLSGNFTFLDYEKQIYRTSDAIEISKLQLKNSALKVNDFFRERIGLYVENVEIEQT